MVDLKTCKCCNKYKYTLSSAISRHIKKCDPECLTYTQYLIKYEIGEHPKCIQCGDLTHVSNIKIHSMCKKCSKMVGDSKIKQKAIIRFSDENIKNEIIKKRIETNIKTYGVNYASQSEQVKTKSKKTNLQKYGQETTLNLKNVKDARNKSLLDNKDIINIKRKNAWTVDKVNQAKDVREQTLINLYGVNTVMKIDGVIDKISQSNKISQNLPEVRQKIIDTLLLRYSVTSISKLDSTKDKIRETSNIRYGSNHYLSSNIRRRECEESGKWTPLDLVSDFRRYHRLCISETNKNKKQLFLLWNGKCHYTGEILITDKLKYNDTKYRTIDHKISIFNGFVNNTPPVEIGALGNLVVCSRSINSRKNVNNSYE